MATSAKALAKGAMDAIKTNDLVSAATNILSSVTGDNFQEKVDQDFTNYYYYNYDSYNGYYYPTGH